MSKIKIKDLQLWHKNPRFPEGCFEKTEKELISYLFKKEKNRMLNLASSKYENSDLQPLEKLVVWDSKGGFIVLEGNRRLAIYKLFNNPDLISLGKDLKFIKEKSKEIAIGEDFEVECIIVKNREEGLRYVEVKHLEKGYSNWQESERINFQKRRGISIGEKELIKHEMNKIVKNLDLPQKLIDKVLGQGNLTNFYRIVASTPAKIYFNYEINENNLTINDHDFESKLKIIIWHVVNKKDFNNNPLNSRSLNTNEDIEKYLASLSVKEDLEKLRRNIDESYKDKIDVFGEKTEEFVLPTKDTSKKNRKSPIKIPDDKIFGKTLTLREGEVNNLYRAIDEIYEQNKNNERKLNTVLPIIGMSLRLILDVAAREYLLENNSEKLKGKNSPFSIFLKEIKCKLNSGDTQKMVNTLSVSKMLASNENLEAFMNHYAHGSIHYTKSDVLNLSKTIGEILECYFSKK
ncbi:MAG: hypothetical protein ACOCUT_00500 [bacterium]